MSDYREGCIEAKKVKAGIIEPRPVGNKSKRPTPVTLYAFLRFSWKGDGEWCRVGDYRNEETAMTAAKNHARKYRFYKRFRMGKAGAEFDPRTNEKSPATR